MSRFTHFLLFLALLFPGLAFAQPQQVGPWVFTVEGGALHQSRADLKDSDDDFELDRWFFGAGVDYLFSPRNAIGISVGAGRSSYNFAPDGDFGGGLPWDKIDDQRVSFTGRFGFGETGSVILIPSVRWNGEKDASRSDSQTLGLLAGVAWRTSDSLTIGPGIGVFSRLEDGSRVFPILVIDWDISERWNLSTGRGLAASQGPGLTLSYQLNKAWSFGLAGRYENIEFRFDEEGVAPNGTGRDKSFPLVATARLQPNRMIDLSVFIGVELAGRLQIRNAADEVIQESDYDPAALFGATFAFRF